MYCTKPYLWFCKKNQQAVFSTPAHCCNVLNITWLLKNKWKAIWLNHMRVNRKWCITCSAAVLGPKTAVCATELYRPGMKPQWRRFSSWWVGGWRCAPGDGTAGHLGPPQCNWVESQVGSHQESRPAGEQRMNRVSDEMDQTPWCTIQTRSPKTLKSTKSAYPWVNPQIPTTHQTETSKRYACTTFTFQTKLNKWLATSYI